MVWATVLRMRDGSESAAGVHGTYSAARAQAEEFNRRYQAPIARVEPFDPDAPWAAAAHDTGS